MLNIDPDYVLTDADYAKAVDLDWLEFADNPRELLPAEREFVYVLTKAANIKKETGKWPTYKEVQP